MGQSSGSLALSAIWSSNGKKMYWATVVEYTAVQGNMANKMLIKSHIRTINNNQYNTEGLHSYCPGSVSPHSVRSYVRVTSAVHSKHVDYRYKYPAISDIMFVCVLLQFLRMDYAINNVYEKKFIIICRLQNKLEKRQSIFSIYVNFTSIYLLEFNCVSEDVVR